MTVRANERDVGANDYSPLRETREPHAFDLIRRDPP